MIVISRGLARSFRALARRCVSGRPRGPAPAVVFESRAGTLTVWTRTDDAVLGYTAPAPGGDDRIVVPMAALEAVEGGGDDPVELAVGPKLRGVARWTDRGEPRTHPFDAILPGKQHHLDDPSDDWPPVPPAFLTALHECGRTAAREPSRYALTRVQVRGHDGLVIGTDGKTALLWGAFVFPFADSLLVPAVPVFGVRDLVRATDVRVGRTAAGLGVRAGPWRVFLPADAAGKYPDVPGVVPRTVSPTTLTLDEADARRLVEALPQLPGAADEHCPVTLDLAPGRPGIVRAVGAEGGPVAELVLDRSPVTNGPSRAAIDRAILARALTLGCRTLQVVGSDKPIVATGGDLTLVAAGLSPDLIVGPAPAAGPVRHPQPERRIPMKPPESNGHPANGRPDPPAGDPPDPLAEAEALRAILAEAAARAGRLVLALKSQKREKKVLTQVWAGLRQLNLGPGGQP